MLLKIICFGFPPILLIFFWTPLIEFDFFLAFINNKSTNNLIGVCVTVPVGYLGRCPPHNLTSEYFQITVLRSITPFVGGCGYIQQNPKEIKRQSFSLWIANFKTTEQQCREKSKCNKLLFKYLDSLLVQCLYETYFSLIITVLQVYCACSSYVSYR